MADSRSGVLWRSRGTHWSKLEYIPLKSNELLNHCYHQRTLGIEYDRLAKAIGLGLDEELGQLAQHRVLLMLVGAA